MNHQSHIDTPALSLFRFLFATAFFLFFWVRWGWGVAIAAALVMMATGVQGEKRSVFVPVPGGVRLIIEFVYFLFGVITVYMLFGKIWGVAAAILVVVLLLLNMKRYRHLSAVH